MAPLATIALVASLCGGALQAQSASPPSHWGAVSINLEDIPYPHPVQFLDRNLFGQDVRIAYMDVAPVGEANGQTVVPLHGGSYYGWYWKDTIEALRNEGYRVVVKDRLGASPPVKSPPSQVLLEPSDERVGGLLSVRVTSKSVARALDDH